MPDMHDVASADTKQVWVPRQKNGQDGSWCCLHRKWFAKSAVCERCDEKLWASAAVVSLSAPVVAPKGCKSLIQHERDCTEIADKYAYSKDPRGFKYRRLAVDLAQLREKRERITRLAEHEAAMKRPDVGN